MRDLFETPIKATQVRKGVTAYKYPNGVINIEGHKYLLFSMTDAIKKWRKDNPVSN